MAHTFTSGPLVVTVETERKSPKYAYAHVVVRDNVWASPHRYFACLDRGWYSFGCAGGPPEQWNHYAEARKRAPYPWSRVRRPLKSWAAVTARVLELLKVELLTEAE
ncbi:MAG: hypothetical protein HOP09_14555 [Hyphomicrobium sp.]|nr:hypothetical protein [Hyphomicrobium sp.]